ncbi:MAG TPA: tetratricopeptide repeat protein [Streptosporangiaceae bacterium]|nr:tetratricopeptide repeat protein [Streptosporangiaceae bacterium]
MSEDGEAFGSHLRAFRRAAGLSQQELAERAGLSVRTIGNLERGTSKWPYRDSLHRLADALGLRDEARAGFIAAAGRRLAPEAVPASTGPGGARQGGRARVVAAYLPATLPVFVGRHDQLATLSRVLQQPGGTAVITAIGGTAGVGKTALAVHWAHQVAGEFPDGQLYVNLRGFDPSGTPVTPEDAVRVLLDALGMPAEQRPQTVEAQLGLYRSLLAGKRMLVLLDNARDAAQVRPLLPGAPTCRVIVTSRNLLTGLVATAGARPLPLDVLTDREASQLLEQRLGADRLAAHPDAAAQIIASCAHLPLALSVIAARAAMRPHLDLREIAAELAARPPLDALRDDSDPAADIRAAFSWSYRQLDPEAARAFRLAGLHPGPDLERYAVAALSATTADQEGQSLGTLAHASMIQSAGPARYGMHDLLRGYARELAAADGAQAQRQALTRLFDYYLYAAAAAMDTLVPSERHRRPRVPAPDSPIPALASEAEARAWLDAERANLVAVTAHMADEGWPGHAIRLATTLYRYLDTGGHFADAVAVHSRARHAARGIGDQVAEAHALHNLGAVDLRLGRYPQGAASMGQALDLLRATGDRPGQARALANLGLAALLQGHSRQAVGHFTESLALYRETGDRTGQARALGNLGFAALRQGRYGQAARDLGESLALCRETGDRGGEARALANLGEVALRQDRYQEAARHLYEALALLREVGDQASEADTLASLGVINLRQGRFTQAAEHLQQALALLREAGDLSRQAMALNSMGELFLATGHPDEARARYAEALSLAARAGEMYEQARAHQGLASSYQQSGDTRRAHRHWREALTRYTELGAPEAEQVYAELAGDAARV